MEQFDFYSEKTNENVVLLYKISFKKAINFLDRILRSFTIILSKIYNSDW